MHATLPPLKSMSATAAQAQDQTFAGRRSVSDILAPLERLAAGSIHLAANHTARFGQDGETYTIPRYLFVGPRGGDESLRIGIFAGVHGDEPEGIHALVRFLSLLETQPGLATGYSLFVYPVCNPTGVKDGTRRVTPGRAGPLSRVYRLRFKPITTNETYAYLS